MFTWTWLKEKTAEAVVNALMAGFILLVAWAILQAFLGDYRTEKIKDEVKREMVEKHNDAVSREADLLKRIEALAGAVDDLQKGVNKLQSTLRQAQPTIPIPEPDKQPPQQQQPPSDAKMDWIEKFRQRLIPNAASR
jgi:cytochrome bd-type quinol oxidase subunit 1